MLEPTLHLHSFDDLLYLILIAMILPLTVGVQTIHTLLHMVESKLQYNILLG